MNKKFNSPSAQHIGYCPKIRGCRNAGTRALAVGHAIDCYKSSSWHHIVY